MKNINNNDFDAMFAKMESDFPRHVKTGVLGMGLVIALVALVLTVVGVVLSLTVSPWFWIAVVITGGYTLMVIFWLITARAITKNLR